MQFPGEIRRCVPLATLRSVSTYTYTQADYVYVVCGPYVYVEVSARKFKVCCKTVKVIPKLPGDSVLPIGGGQEHSRGVNVSVNSDPPLRRALRIRRGLCIGARKWWGLIFAADMSLWLTQGCS